MSESFDRTTLPHDVQKELQRIVSKSVGSLTDEEVAFLRARRAYLTAAERDAFGIGDDADASAGSGEKPKKGKPKKGEVDVDSSDEGQK